MSVLPPASLSLDLDNKWAYLRAAGNKDWEQAESYFPIAISRIVEILGEYELPLTVFMVGRDLANEYAADLDAIDSFSTLPAWEPANHSLNHLPWMHTMEANELRDEIAITHDQIRTMTGETPRGFRGPGFSCPPEVLDVLSELGYLYDASIFPTSMAPIARAVFLARTDLRGEDREKAKQLYGGFASMRKPNHPHLRSLREVLDAECDEVLGEAGHDLWEIPVTVMPILRTPIHFSYLNFVAQFSVPLAKLYFRSALSACRILRVAPSLLLHPPDFLGCEDDQEMAYFPGMKASRHKKLEFMRWALKLYSQKFQVQTMIEQVSRLNDSRENPQTLYHLQSSIQK